ncbi:MAG: DUF547 domain-containing protein [Bacteroidota bacterium]
MFNNIILSILLSLHLGACTSATNQSDNTVIEAASEIEKAPTATAQTTTTVDTPDPTPTPPTKQVADEPNAEEVKVEEKSQAPATKEIKVKPTREVIPAPAEAPEIEEIPSVTTNVEAIKEAPKPEPSAPKVEIQEENKEPAVQPTPPVKPNHTNWNSLLVKYVNSRGDVNYAGFKADKAKLQAYLDELSNNPPQSSWSRNEKMAFWINAYNAFTIKLIIDNYPVKSITNLKGGKPWDVKWVKIGAKTYSLNNIENDILRPQYKDARIHFAVNCAAESCPPLLNKAWTASQLNNYFEKQAKAFINNTSYNKITASKVQVSKIFDWYKEDFGNLIDYLNQYSNTKIKSNAKVEFLEYDWVLNKQ